MHLSSLIDRELIFKLKELKHFILSKPKHSSQAIDVKYYYTDHGYFFWFIQNNLNQKDHGNYDNRT